MAPDGTVWLSTGMGVEAWAGANVTRHLEDTLCTGSIFVGPDGTVGVTAWDGIHLYDGSEWSLVAPNGAVRRAASPDGTLGVVVARRDGLRLYHDGEVTHVLQGTRLDEIAAAPDGFVLAGRRGGQEQRRGLPCRPGRSLRRGEPRVRDHRRRHVGRRSGHRLAAPAPSLSLARRP